MGELAARLNREERDLADSPVSPAQLAWITLRVSDGTVSHSGAKKLLDALWAKGGIVGVITATEEGQDAAAFVGSLSPQQQIDEIIEAQGLKQVTDASAIEPIIDEVLAANPKSVEEYRAGKEKAFNALVGQVMKASKGKASPAQVNELLKKKLGG